MNYRNTTGVVFLIAASISGQWYNRGYHCSPKHNSRGVIQRYLGYWDVNPATLIPLSMIYVRSA